MQSIAAGCGNISQESLRTLTRTSPANAAGQAQKSNAKSFGRSAPTDWELQAAKRRREVPPRDRSDWERLRRQVLRRAWLAEVPPSQASFLRD
jgi:hypothetical protein